jgi:hemoglobin
VAGVFTFPGHSYELKHMRDAVDSIELTPQQETELWSYMERAAHSMVNTFDEHPGTMPGLRIT